MEKKEFKLAEVKHKCPICHRTYTGYGHNALPVWPGRCCDKCNRDYVIPARMAMLVEQEKDKKEDD